MRKNKTFNIHCPKCGRFMWNVGYHYVCLNKLHEAIWIYIESYKEEKNKDNSETQPYLKTRKKIKEINEGVRK